jgi:hypothetical protein
MRGPVEEPAVSAEVYLGRRAVGNVDAMFDPKVEAFVVRFAHIEQSVQGKGIGAAVYGALRDYVRRVHGKPLASDSKRSDAAEKLWGRMSQSGKARHVQSPGERGGYYVTDSIWRTLASIMMEAK